MSGRRLVIVAERDHSYIDLDEKSTLIIGRAPDNDIVVKDDMVSRKHAQIEQDPNGSLRVRDLKSFNGTYLNERRVRDEELSLWDALRVGRTKMFLVERVETPATAKEQTAVVAKPDPEEEQEPEVEQDMGATKTLEVNDVLASKEMRAVVDQVVRREREDLERQICRRIRDESGPSLLGSLSGFKVRVRRVGPPDGGGDFYDVFTEPLLANDLFLSLGSVSGVGIAACVAATVGRHTLRGMCATRDEEPIKQLDPLREVLSHTLHPGSALSLLLARLNTSGKVRIAAMGGTGALHYNSATDAVEILRPPGRRDEEAARPEALEVTLRPDDRLLLVSDGGGAIRNAETETFGATRLQEKLGEVAGQPPKELVKALTTAYQQYCGEALERDVTLMLVTQAGA